ncbi:hypothetical protein [Sandaracinus amylolyticus]|uniref:hypothetical protein n=1 Tax=Sandaracinus amylolyticus TaxID=927083 RepID=UPI001F479280|nr:hypothetical protein [Sandaracinus amylolyticus]UJR78223.1 Hypothetical protein I5071_2500 [Sandaracinus amylolyticus]
MTKRRIPMPPRWLLFVLGILPAVLAIGIFAFIARFQLAHDEARCPFEERETRDVASGLRVREDARRCLPEIEEHRWLVLRDGHEPLELGRFPLEAEQITAGFPWSASVDDGRAVVTVTNEGRGDLVFREPDLSAPH